MRAALVTALCLAACVADPSTAAHESELCTIVDQEAGLCSGPAGGWASVEQHTLTEAVGVDPTAMGDPISCGYFSDGRATCTMTLQVLVTVVITCWEVTVGGAVKCSWFAG